MHQEMLSQVVRVGQKSATVVRECSGVNNEVHVQREEDEGGTDTSITVVEQNRGNKFQLFYGHGVIS